MAGRKRTLPSPGDAAGTIADGEQIVVSGLQPGAYHAEEIVPAGWTLTDIVCDDANSVENLLNFEAEFHLEAGETVKCTFYNLLELDYGDAPDVNYKTLLASNGARHVIIAGTQSGSGCGCRTGWTTFVFGGRG